MPSAQIQCHGCGKHFTPSGLSQYLSKTQDLRCHRSSIQTDSVSVSLSDRRMLDSDPIQVSPDPTIPSFVQSYDGMSPSHLDLHGSLILTQLTQIQTVPHYMRSMILPMPLTPPMLLMSTLPIPWTQAMPTLPMEWMLKLPMPWMPMRFSNCHRVMGI